MNAKDKAWELINKYWLYASVDEETAIKCALIVVTEMLNSMSIQSTDECQYWEQVKQEIDNL
jgi:hypothetical protein